MASLKRRIGAGVAILAVSLISLVLSTYFLFPYTRVADYVAQEIERPRGANGDRKASGWRLSVGAVHPSFVPGGATLSDVHVVKVSPSKGTLKLSFKDISVRVGLFSLLFGSRQIDFDARLKRGRITGSFADSETQTGVKLTLKRVDLSDGNLMGALTGIPMQGTLEGTIDLRVDDDPQATEGNIELSVDELVLGDEKLSIPLRRMGPLNLPAVRAGRLDLAVNVNRGLGNIQRFSGAGEDVAVRGVGEIQVLRPLQQSKPQELWIRVEPSEAYQTGDDLTSMAFTLLKQNRQASRYLASDGAFQIQLAGAFSRMSVLPAGTKTLPPATAE